MTDEELAEERATKYADINFNEPDNYGSAKEVGHFSYAAGFLAGLKEGKPKWHKVTDGDLPKGKGVVLIYWKSGDVNCVSVVEPYRVTEDTHIIAWKEIIPPKEVSE